MTVGTPKYRELGLTDSEYELIVEKLGREPNDVELAMFSLLWSEHCAYKHSRKLLRRLPTEGVPPTAHPLPRVNAWREDVPGPCLTREEALSTAPEVEQDRFKVPRIIEEAP